MNKRFICQECGYNSNKKCNMIKHIWYKHKREPTADELSKKHILSENTEPISSTHDQSEASNIVNTFVCEKCTKEFKTKQGLKNHISRCTGVSNILECPFCHRIFTRYQSKSKHLKICKIKEVQDNRQIEQQRPEASQTQPLNEKENFEINQILLQTLRSLPGLQGLQADYLVILPLTRI